MSLHSEEQQWVRFSLSKTPQPGEAGKQKFCADVRKLLKIRDEVVSGLGFCSSGSSVFSPRDVVPSLTASPPAAGHGDQL